MTSHTLKALAIGLTASTLSLADARPAAAQAEPLLGQLMIFGGNFCPRGWANANGALLAINANTALFSILGTTYGGDGRTTFALPDLQGRAAVNAGSGPGIEPRNLGEKGGANAVTLSTQQMPAHSHALQVQQTPADQPAAAGNFLPGVLPGESLFSAPNAAAPRPALAAESIGSTGGGQPVSVQDPYLALTICIATVGIFPSRS